MALYRSWNKQFNHFTYFKNGRYFIQCPTEKYQEQYFACVEHYFSWDNAEQYIDKKDIKGRNIYSGDILDLHQTVYGCSKFLVVWDIHAMGWNVKYLARMNTPRNYEYSLADFFNITDDGEGVEIISNIHQGKTVESDKEYTV